jgi:predicted nuclease with TOPRIM domain
MGEGMTKQEAAKLRRLEAENARLREVLDKHAAVYRDQLYEIVELRTQLDLVRDALGMDATT